MPKNAKKRAFGQKVNNLSFDRKKRKRNQQSDVDLVNDFRDTLSTLNSQSTSLDESESISEESASYSDINLDDSSVSQNEFNITFSSLNNEIESVSLRESFISSCSFHLFHCFPSSST